MLRHAANSSNLVPELLGQMRPLIGKLHTGAARPLGGSIDTINRHASAGELKGQQGGTTIWPWPGADRAIPAEDTFATAPAEAPASTIDAPAGNGLVAALQNQIFGLHEQVISLTQQLSIKDSQLSELLVVTRQAKAMLPPPAERKGWLRYFRDVVQSYPRLTAPRWAPRRHPPLG